MKKTVVLTFLMLLFSFAASAYAKVNVVATLPFIGSIAKEIGGDKVDVTTLVKPTQDPHFVDAKPSMILAARKADVLMYNGLDLEIGYLPLLMESSRNPKIQPGKPGNFDCSRYVSVIEKPAFVDRSMGDVHPLGNPHYLYSPKNVIRVTESITEELSTVDPANAGYYRSNFAAFKEKFDRKQAEWNAKKLSGKKFIAYHKYFEYLASEFGFQIVGYLEPKPGIPPSARHIEGLIESTKISRPDAIICTANNGIDQSRALGARTGLKVAVVPQDVGATSEAKDWFSFMDQVLKSLE
ncbi:MAG: zinc ABC transporter substrate-binding protein [Deltaproteobacteria bacterium]|nr:zinc ABC transporter substrate-binding protein [Deltaproteobacteria bacterium]MBZ0219888.1 metal ABC transporter substrate-binding protein [Deltaproteobacteria bacterium]